VRSGAFCAHPLVAHLLELDHHADAPEAGRPAGAVRVSIGLGVDAEQIDAFLAAVGGLAVEGPQRAYVLDPVWRQFVPRDDVREWPDLGIRLA
jgi:hypothetical protein